VATRCVSSVLECVALSLVFALPVFAQGPPEAPQGTVAFFGTASCPAGWTAAANAAGLVLVATTDPKAVGKSVGVPLVSKEDRQHAHAYSGTVPLRSKSISGASGCCNDQGASKADYQITDDTEPATSGLPFTQLVVCEKL
jgi:hypothetical protein